MVARPRTPRGGIIVKPADPGVIKTARVGVQTSLALSSRLLGSLVFLLALASLSLSPFFFEKRERPFPPSIFSLFLSSKKLLDLEVVGEIAILNTSHNY